MVLNTNMKQIVSASILIFICCILSCKKTIVSSNNDLKKIDCDKLKIGIMSTDSKIVKLEINKLVTDLKPIKTSNDNIGQKENVDIVINRLNTLCNELNAELMCYACIETLPVQSEILLSMDSIGTTISRVIDIWTPENSILNFIRIHK
jgi:hypothetical protein